ncbi:Endonuclease/exonuclease/phosphatase [Phyllosticta citriasiana]|uniref:DNA-(apurinic or apyrimidinic site) endonuclease n=1 Tax=Phyllosticta citriasiana TaxID=595635 RepID=A0ABR1KLM3_9PEZI
MPLRITSWNVNGIRNPFGYQPWRDKRSFDAMFGLLEADIVVMQELKIQRKDLTDDMVLVPGWDCYFSLPKHKKGYSGVAIYTRQSACVPIRAEEGVLGVLCPPGSSTSYRNLPADQAIGGYPTDEQIAAAGVDPAALDAEGRCVALEFPAFVILGVYSPANSNGMRDDFRYGFLCALDARIRNLTALGKNVILTGDLNVSRQELDTANAEETLKKEGITHEEYVSSPNRRIFNQLLENGEVVGSRDEGREQPVLWDTCREFHPTRKGMYTHWEQKINARPGNFGSRIDYVLCSIAMKDWICDANIQEGLMGSDHCPVYAMLKDRVTLNGVEYDLPELMNSPGTFQDGQRKIEWSFKSLPVLCGRLLPEFDRRRSIKDMFTRKKSASAASPGASISVAANHSATSSNGSPDVQRPTEPEPSAASAISSEPRQPSEKKAPFAEPTKSPEKKRNTAGGSTAKSTKRQKLGPASSKSNPAKGQQSLTGFLKPAARATNNGSAVNEPGSRNTLIEKERPTTPVNLYLDPGRPSPKYSSSQGAASQMTEDLNGTTANSPSTSEKTAAAGDDRSAAIESASNSSVALEEFRDIPDSRETWSRLFAKRDPPRCEDHGEFCIRLTTKKSGVNCGRAFWICPRPIGPSGSKEKGTEWRCPTFIWASDWNGSTAAP